MAPQGLPRWQRDLDTIDRWCQGVESEWWAATLYPMLIAHPDLHPKGRSAEQRFRTRVPSEAGVMNGKKVTVWKVRERGVRELSAGEWRKSHPDLARVWDDAQTLSCRQWRLRVRTLILRHLWEHGEKLGALAERFGLSERQVRRLLEARVQEG
jgi:hypothetical protein